nr:retrotransposon protein, putative, Ty1-copia subclass [Tanacetum cinerariifolium]
MLKCGFKRRGWNVMRFQSLDVFIDSHGVTRQLDQRKKYLLCQHLAPSIVTYYPKYLWEFWYMAEADSVTKSVTFTLSHFDKPLSFDLDVFSTVIGFERSEDFVSIPPKETVKSQGVTRKLDQRIKYLLCQHSAPSIGSEPLPGITTRSKVKDLEVASAHECMHVNFLSEMEPKKLIDALEEKGWIIAIQEELNQFERNKVWTLVPKPHGKTIIGTKWKISEEMYVQQPPRFESNEFSNHVCKLDKALYGLKQAPKAWYETLLKFLIQHKFVRAKGILQHLVPQDIWLREKHIELVNIIGEPLPGITTRSKVKDLEVASAHECMHVNFLSEMEPKKLIDALEEKRWIIAIQEELNQFERNKV